MYLARGYWQNGLARKGSLLRRVLDNMAAVLDAAGCGFKDVVRCTIFLKSMDDFATVNEVYARRFEADPPSRACVEVSRLPKDVDVEIDAIAIKTH